MFPFFGSWLGGRILNISGKVPKVKGFFNGQHLDICNIGMHARQQEA